MASTPVGFHQIQEASHDADKFDYLVEQFVRNRNEFVELMRMKGDRVPKHLYYGDNHRYGCECGPCQAFMNDSERRDEFNTRLHQAVVSIVDSQRDWDE